VRQTGKKKTKTPPLIEVRDLHKNYGELAVLRGVSLAASAGDIVSLIGSSGSGKSTLLRCINLLENSEQGEISFQGEAIRWAGSGAARRPADAAQLRAVRTQLSMVFQQFNLWSHMTIMDNVIRAPITVLGRDHEQMRQKALSLLDKVGIADKANAWPAQLSGGQQQRAAIARALAMEPAALLFDEPTSALDPELEQEVIKVIRALAEEGRTMLLVTHDMKLARDLSSRVIFLEQGVIEEEGSASDLFGKPKSARLRQFLSASAA
jgi:polar amino acid transport system ATP-binding protein